MTRGQQHLNLVPFWSSAMLLHWLTETSLRGIYLLSRLFGLMAATVPQLGAASGSARRVRAMRYWRIHSYVVFIFVLGFSPYAFHEIYSFMGFLRLNSLLFIVGVTRYGLLALSTLGTHYLHSRHQHRLIDWINALLRCRRQLLRLLHESRARRSVLQLQTREHLFTVYLLIVSMVCSSAHSVFILLYDPVAQRSFKFFFSVLFFYVCQLSLQLCLALYLLALLLLGHLWHHCNCHLHCLLEDALQGQQKMLAQRQPRVALLAAQQRWLAHELWRLTRLHSQLLQLGRQLCSLHSLQLFAFITFAVIECIVHGFFTYFVMFSRWWIHRFGHGGGININGMIFLCGLCVQMTLVILYTHRQRQILTATRHTLQTGTLALLPGCSKALRETVSSAIDYYRLQSIIRLWDGYR